MQHVANVNDKAIRKRLNCKPLMSTFETLKAKNLALIKEGD